MTAKKKPSKGQAKSKKLQLHKETAKDLSVSDSDSKKAKGGVGSILTCRSCVSCVYTCSPCKFGR